MALCSAQRELTQYYDNGLWLADYEADERGELPFGRKRGVLAQDGGFDLLEAIRAAIVKPFAWKSQLMAAMPFIAVTLVQMRRQAVRQALCGVALTVDLEKNRLHLSGRCVIMKL